MKTIFLASGKSSRMDPISDKNFLEFLGEPLCLKLLKNATSGGAENFIIVSNGNNLEGLKKLCAENNFLNSAQVVVQKDLSTGMAGGIGDALSEISDDEEVLILGGNDFFEGEILKELISQGLENDGALLAQKVETYFPGGYLEIDENKKIKSIVEKPGVGNEPSALVNMVAHFFTRAGDLKTALSAAQSQNDDVYEVALDALFQAKNFVAVEYEGIWQTIKFPWHILDMMGILKDEKLSPLVKGGWGDFKKVGDNTWVHKTAEIAESATIKSGTIIDEGARVFENAVVQNSYIGKKGIVGNNALVRDSHLGEGSVAGYNTEIARSYLAQKVMTHMAYVGDSVVDSEVNFGAYSCTANLRLDRAKVKVKIKGERVDSGHQKLGAIVKSWSQIGIGAKLMPGVKIVNHVGPGEIVK